MMAPQGTGRGRALIRLGARATVLALAVALVWVPDWPALLTQAERRIAALQAENLGPTTADTVYVTGARHGDLEAISAAVAEPGAAADARAVKAAVEALPWIDTASVRRHALGPWHVTVREHTPFARWQIGEERWLVTRDGHRITRDGLHEFTDLPLLAGPGAPSAAAEILAVLDASPSLKRQVHALVRLGERRWDVVFKTGITVSLPEPGEGYGPARAWSKFVALNREHRLLDREIIAVDMRLAERLTVWLTARGKAMIHAEKRRS